MIYTLRRRRRSSISDTSPTNYVRFSYHRLLNSNIPKKTFESHIRVRRPDMSTHDLDLKSWTFRKCRSTHKSSQNFVPIDSWTYHLSLRLTDDSDKMCSSSEKFLDSKYDRCWTRRLQSVTYDAVIGRDVNVEN